MRAAMPRFPINKSSPGGIDPAEGGCIVCRATGVAERVLET